MHTINTFRLINTLTSCAVVYMTAFTGHYQILSLSLPAAELNDLRVPDCMKDDCRFDATADFTQAPTAIFAAIYRIFLDLAVLWEYSFHH